MTDREALKLALEALEYPLNQSHENFNVDMAELISHRAITAIKEALAQPEQEPVGFTIQAEIDYAKNNQKEYAGFWANKDDDDEDWIALYTTPPQRTWVGLTPDEIRGISLASGESLFSAIMFTHDKLKEKNT